jgi:hypothetical protein
MPVSEGDGMVKRESVATLEIVGAPLMSGGELAGVIAWLAQEIVKLSEEGMHYGDRYVRQYYGGAEEVWSPTHLHEANEWLAENLNERDAEIQEMRTELRELNEEIRQLMEDR